MSNVLTADAVSVAAQGRLLEPLDFAPSADEVRAEAMAGLSGRQKMLPCKLFYDERGSKLFDEICHLPEYYPTRTELRIMRDYAAEMAVEIGPRPLIVEYGSGSSVKTRVLLDQMPDAEAYIPIDISGEHLLNAARGLQDRYPALSVLPVCADYTRPLTLAHIPKNDSSRNVAYFPGSTIGNLEPAAAKAFLKAIRATCGRESRLLIGLDLKKDPATIHAAYNDAAGVTAAFNLNVLRRLNEECGADFELDSFCHYAFYNPTVGRVEMHLVSKGRQVVSFPGGESIYFEEGETIHTENCYKYTLQEFADLAAVVGYRRENVWLDEQNWFSVQLFAGAQ
jgi:dimethylhistidine N-methyltransferase